MSSEEQLYHITTNLSGKSTRHERIADRDYLVVPMVMIVEGVLNANQGPLYYPKEELAKFPGAWNHKPIVVYHPQIHGQGVSACDPTILTTQQVGIIMNARYVKNELKAEAWLEEERIAKIDPRIAEAISTNTMMELSTGLYLEYESKPGEFNGVKYDAIAKNFKPDHLAILPDKVGASSIKDGAGFLRNELSLELIKEQLNAIIINLNQDAYVVDVYKNDFIFTNKGKLYKQNYIISKNKISTTGLSVEVIRRYEYIVVNNEKHIHTIFYDEKGDTMTDADKKIIVDNLIKDKPGLWSEKDREFLMSHNEEDLKHIELKEEPKLKPVAKAEAKPEIKEEVIENKKKEEPKTMTVEQFITNAPKEMQDVLRHGQETYNKVRAALIAKVIANENNVFSEEQLNAKPIEDLRGLVALCGTEEAEVFNYSGQAEVIGNDTQEALPVPITDWSK